MARPGKPCAECGELPARLEVVWRMPPEEEKSLPAAAGRLRKLAGYEYYGEGLKLLGCDACGARFEWYASHETLASACDYWKSIARVDAAGAKRVEAQIAEILKHSPFLAK